MVGDINWMMNQIFKKNKMVGNHGWMFGDFQAFLIFKDLGRSIIHLIATSHFQGFLEKRGNPLGVPHPLNALARYQCVELKFDGYRRHLDWWLPDVYRCLPLGNLDRFSMISRSTNSSKTGEKWDDFFKRVQQQAGISKYFFLEILHFWVVQQFWPY